MLHLVTAGFEHVANYHIHDKNNTQHIRWRIAAKLSDYVTREENATAGFKHVASLPAVRQVRCVYKSHLLCYRVRNTQDEKEC